MSLTVPPAQIAHIKKFLELSDDKFQEFLEVLADAGPQFNVFDLAREVSRKLDLPKDVVLGIVQVLGSIYLTKDSQETPSETFVDQEVYPALKKADTFSKEKPDMQWARLRKFLISALSLEKTVGTAAKAGYV